MIGFQLRVRVAELREVGRARLGVELGEQRVVARLLRQLRDLALGIVEVAEDDRVGGAGLLAGA